MSHPPAAFPSTLPPWQTLRLVVPVSDSILSHIQLCSRQTLVTYYELVLVTVLCSFCVCVCVHARACMRVHWSNCFSYEFCAYSSHQWGIHAHHRDAKGHVTCTWSSTVNTFTTSKLSVLKDNPCCWNSALYHCVTILYHNLMEFQFLHRLPSL